MFPKESVTNVIRRDGHGRIISAPVLWYVDFGPGQCAANTLESTEWDVWAKEMWENGILIMPLLPNSTAITALMDYLFRPFKTACHEPSQFIDRERLQKNSEAIQKIKAALANGMEVPKSIES